MKRNRQELLAQCSYDVNLEQGDHYCQVSNCFRKAWKKRGFSWRCPLHYYHQKFCHCEECNQKYNGSILIKETNNIII